MKIFVILLLITAALSVNGQLLVCSEFGVKCTNSVQCCSSYCYSDKCTKWGLRLEEENQVNPCLTKDCNGRRCLLQQASCISQPCLSIAECKK